MDFLSAALDTVLSPLSQHMGVSVESCRTLFGRPPADVSAGVNSRAKDEGAGYDVDSLFDELVLCALGVDDNGEGGNGERMGLALSNIRYCWDVGMCKAMEVMVKHSDALDSGLMEGTLGSLLIYLQDVAQLAKARTQISSSSSSSSTLPGAEDAGDGKIASNCGAGGEGKARARARLLDNYHKLKASEQLPAFIHTIVSRYARE
jgi:hypothetical protein